MSGRLDAGYRKSQEIDQSPNRCRRVCVEGSSSSSRGFKNDSGDKLRQKHAGRFSSLMPPEMNKLAYVLGLEKTICILKCFQIGQRAFQLGRHVVDVEGEGAQVALRSLV